nr:uncharacterized protein LOC120096591 isoform X5 [Rattus norvegicus]
MKRRPTKTSEVMHGIAMQEHPFTVEWTHLRSAEMGKTRENETVLKQFERFEIVFMLRGPRKLQKSFSIQDFFFFLEIGKFYKMQPIKSPHLELKRKSPSRSISFFLEDFFNEAGKISLRISCEETENRSQKWAIMQRCHLNSGKTKLFSK